MQINRLHKDFEAPPIRKFGRESLCSALQNFSVLFRSLLFSRVSRFQDFLQFNYAVCCHHRIQFNSIYTLFHRNQKEEEIGVVVGEMDSNSWSTRLSTAASRRLLSRSDLYLGGGYEETEHGDDESGALFLCPFCAEDFDIVGLCCHIDEDHPIEAKNGVSFWCALFARRGWERILLAISPCNMGTFLKYPFAVDFTCVIFIFYLLNVFSCFSLILEQLSFACFLFQIMYLSCFVLLSAQCFCLLVPFCLIPTLLHGHDEEYQSSLTVNYVQRKRRFRKVGSNSTFSMLRKELRDGNLQSLLGGSSYLLSSSNNTEPDPLLSSFIFNSPKVDEPVSVQPLSMVEAASIKESSNENFRERNTQKHPLSHKDQEEKARKSEFVQGLLMSTILDDYL
ncbi:hypothetical protein EZV62_000225 [Acer yangbiense]|uniref:Protein dehydration-induced 19 C-terminal domain-containing protein n=1 Tax=Acer yangbiense TaxID=1000413 RepID=A0A5C7ITF3_9ROSI|nr:hypothetical protein EZV62_000225 [Acer yangbiense]